MSLNEHSSLREVVLKMACTHRSGAQNIETGAGKNYGNAPKLKSRLIKFWIQLFAL
jgi:hypothetical protein